MKYKFKYPRVNQIISYNKLILNHFKVKRKDSHQVLSKSKIGSAIQSARVKRGDVEDKAAVLMRRLSLGHPFSAGNRRTAYFSANKMIGLNKGYLLAKKRDKQVELQRKIRYRKIDDKGIAKWLRE